MIILLILLMLLVLPLTSCCLIPNIIGNAKNEGTAAVTSEISQAPTSSTDLSDSSDGTAREENIGQDSANNNGDNSNKNGTPSDNYRIIYFEVTSSGESNHFEHRVANVY